MVLKALEAAAILEKEGISAEVVDLRTIKPLDEETVLNSIRKTSRLLVFQEAWLSCSVASEVSAMVAEKGIEYLDGPVRRIGSKDVPIPFGRELSNYVHPQVDDVVRTVREMV